MREAHARRTYVLLMFKNILVIFVRPVFTVYNVLFAFAFTALVKHKINSAQILGFILICLYFTTGHFHTYILC